MKIWNNNGPKWEPCWTSDEPKANSDAKLPIVTACWRSVVYYMIETSQTKCQIEVSILNLTLGKLKKCVVETTKCSIY